MSDYVLLSEAVEKYPFSLRTWRHWRQTGTGPPGRLIGRNIVYRRSDIEEWIESHWAEKSATKTG